MKKVKFSIVIPYYNKIEYIDICLTSLKNQDFVDFEIIFVDDFSDVDITDIIEGYVQEFRRLGIRMKYIRQSSNNGPSHTRNLGILESRGRYIAFLDADDFWHSKKLGIINSFLDEHNPTLLAHHSTSVLENRDIKVDISEFTILKYSRWRILVGNIGTTPAIIVKNNRDFYFDRGMRFSEDYDLWLRIILYNTNIFFLDGPALTYLGRPVLSEGGASSNKLKMRFG